MSVNAKLSSKFQISIPKEIRERQNWKPGQEFTFVPQGNGLMLVPKETIDSLRGIARGADKANYRDRNDRY